MLCLYALSHLLRPFDHCQCPVRAYEPVARVVRCSVQRIAKRAGVLSQERIELLDSIRFDWSGADALS